MRVAIFFDGKNFHAGYRATTTAQRLDFPKLAAWMVERAGGASLWGAHYYTGVERGEGAVTEAQQGLLNFLRALEREPGFFVRRFDRKATRVSCPHCKAEISFTQEKEVDTTLVADILRLAAVDGFDILVLVSGDADLAPAVETVRLLGKKVFVAMWGDASLSARLRQAAFDHIDLLEGLPIFQVAPMAVTTSAPVSVASLLDEDAAAEVFLAKLANAEAKLSGGYVGANYFVHSWRSIALDSNVGVRQRLLDRLVQTQRVERYSAPDGAIAIRRRLIVSDAVEEG